MNRNPDNPLKQELERKLIVDKAKELGVSPDDIGVRIIDGKRTLVRKSDVYFELEKQRKLASPKTIIRSIRGGEDSLHGRIRHEAQHIRDIAKKAIALNPMEKNDAVTSAESIAAAAEKQALEISDLEDQIEEKKSSDPVFQQGEEVMRQMKLAKSQGDAETLERIKSRSVSLFQQYERRQNSIRPFIDSASAGRLVLQRYYWRVLQTAWGLREKEINHAVGQGLNDSSPITSQTARSLQSQAHGLNNQRSLVAGQTPSQQHEDSRASQRWDMVLDTMVTLAKEHFTVYENCMNLTRSLDDSKDAGQKSGPRMAFQDERKTKK